MSGIRLVGSYRLIAATIAMIAVFAGSITGVVLTARTDLGSLDIELPSAYQPGQTLPPDLPHFREYYRSYASITGYVQRVSTHLEYIIEIDMPPRTIRHVSKWVFESQIMLGDLMLRWGTPTGRRGSFVIWPGRSAFVLGDPGFFPTSQVYFVSYGSETEPGNYHPWTGFSRDQDEITTVSLRQLASVFPALP